MFIAAREERIIVTHRQWKDAMEAESLRLKIGKAEMMISSVSEECVREDGEWPCAVCRKGVGCVLVQ